MIRHPLVVAIVGGLLSAAMTACAQTSRERFAPSAIEAKQNLVPEATKGLRIFIEERFGRPDAPQSWEELPVDFGQRDLATGKAAGWKLQAGNALFNKRCAECHGTSGDGAGPRATKLEPRPRDFRRGEFKFRSTGVDERGLPAKPLRHDLAETLRLGVPGTAMPAFDNLQPAEREALVEYVRWLAIRGEFETRLARILQGADNANDVQQMLAGEYKDDLHLLANLWLTAERESSIVRPPKRIEPDAASLAAGKKLFSAEGMLCNKCHADDGKGSPLLAEGWKQQGPVWDLTSGLYRGGIDPDDVFRRLRHGMLGSAMPVYPDERLSDDDMWHVVNYTLSLASPTLREKQVSRRPPPKGLTPAAPSD